jgi:hypothetical protein
MAIVVATVAGAWAGCSDDTDPNPGTGGSSSTKASSSSTGGAPPLPKCEDALEKDYELAEACEPCLADQCCQEVSECAVEGNCPVCITPEEECDSDDAEEAADALLQCASSSCNMECISQTTFVLDCQPPNPSPSMGTCAVGAQFACNPITNDKCDTAGGQACDYGMSGMSCYPAPNTQAVCAECGLSQQGPWCQGGMTCLFDQQQCAKFCCNDQDCSSNGRCDMAALEEAIGNGASFGVMGICVEGGGGAGGGGGMGGAGGMGMGGMGMGGMGMGGMGGAGGN